MKKNNKNNENDKICSFIYNINNNRFADANKFLIDIVNEKLRKRFERAYFLQAKK